LIWWLKDGEVWADSGRGARKPSKAAQILEYDSELSEPSSVIFAAWNPCGRPRARWSCGGRKGLRGVPAIKERRLTGRLPNQGRFRVYDREGERCPAKGCTGTITRIVQAGPSSFFAVCQG